MFIGIFKNTDKKIENYLYNDMIENYFLKNAKRYGLLKEFHENGIC